MACKLIQKMVNLIVTGRVPYLLFLVETEEHNIYRLSGRGNEREREGKIGGRCKYLHPVFHTYQCRTLVLIMNNNLITSSW